MQTLIIFLFIVSHLVILYTFFFWYTAIDAVDAVIDYFDRCSILSHFRQCHNFKLDFFQILNNFTTKYKRRNKILVWTELKYKTTECSLQPVNNHQCFIMRPRYKILQRRTYVLFSYITFAIHCYLFCGITITHIFDQKTVKQNPTERLAIISQTFTIHSYVYRGCQP